MDKSYSIPISTAANSRFSLFHCLAFFAIYGFSLFLSRACWLVESAEESPSLDQGLYWQAITLIALGALINSVALMLWGGTTLAVIRTDGSRAGFDPGFWLVQLLGLAAIFELLTSSLIVVLQDVVNSRGEWLQACLGMVSSISAAVISFVAVIKLNPLRFWQAFFIVNGFGLPIAMLLSIAFRSPQFGLSDGSVDVIALGGALSSVLLILACIFEAPTFKELSRSSQLGIIVFLVAAGWHVAWTTILYRFFVLA